jgi:hypothetical protein
MTQWRIQKEEAQTTPRVEDCVAALCFADRKRSMWEQKGTLIYPHSAIDEVSYDFWAQDGSSPLSFCIVNNYLANRRAT